MAFRLRCSVPECASSQHYWLPIRTAVWATVAFLIVQMFLSYALRSWSLRAGNLAVIGALITFLAGAGHITSERAGWFVLASTVGIAWVTLAEYVILPEDPARSLKRSVDVFYRCAANAVLSVAEALTTRSERTGSGVRRNLRRVKRCRKGLKSQLGDAVFAPQQIEYLQVALYCAERGVAVLSSEANAKRWIDSLRAGSCDRTRGRATPCPISLASNGIGRGVARTPGAW